MDLADLLPHPLDEQDLRTHFLEADGLLGLGSSYGAMVRRLQLRGARGSPVQHDLDGRKLVDATADRLVRRALELVGEEHQGALRACYGQPLRHELEAFGPAAGLAPLTQAAARAYRASRTRRPLEEWLMRLARRAAREGSARVTLAAIRGEAEAALGAAGRAYSRARRSVEQLERARRAGGWGRCA